MIARTLSDRPGTSGFWGTSVQDGVGNDVVVLGGIVDSGLARLRKGRCAGSSMVAGT